MWGAEVMGLINLNGQRTCLLELLSNARVPVPSPGSVSVTNELYQPMDSYG